jgi:hypothetical protein
MEYLITESRLDQVINNFITETIGATLDRQMSQFESVTWYFDLKNNLVFEIDDNLDDGSALGVSEEIWNSVNRMFSLNTYQTDEAFMNWMWNYSGKKFPSGVYTFEPQL